MKIRLPSLPSLANLRRGAAAPPPAPSPSGTMVSPTVAAGGFGERMRLLSRRVRGSAGWVVLAIAAFFVSVWLSLPTRAIAWRIGQQARKAGYLIDIQDMSLRPWGSATLYGVTWTYSPSHPGQVPHSMILDEVDIGFSVLKYLVFGDIDVVVDTAIDEAPVHAEYARSDTESTIKVEVTELPLYDVPKLQQALGAPLRGLFALHVDLTLPENLFAKAEGSINIECASCTIGDGDSLLFIPGSSGITAKGLTIPEIDLGTLQGKLLVKEGKAAVQTFETKSADVELVVTGDMPLKDPFSKSEFAFNMKLLVTPALQEKSETLRFAVQTAGPSSKMDPPDEGWLGFKLRGSVGRPRFMGIKTKTLEERTLERRQKNAERDAAKKARSKPRPKKDTAKTEKDSLERNSGPELPEVERDASERPPASEVELRPIDPPPTAPPAEAERDREDERREPEKPEPPPVEEPARPEVEAGGDGQGQADGQGQGQGEGQADGQAPGEAPREGDAAAPGDAPIN